MKLCKDCKHARLPNQTWGLSNYYPVPMCAHPSAPRDCVEGRLEVTCAGARGITQFLPTNPFCGKDAKLFEEKPAPEPAPDAGSIVWVQADPEIKVGAIDRLFGWLRWI